MSIRRTALGLSALAFAAVIGLFGGAASAAAPAFGLNPFVYDPGNACPGITAAWDNSTGNPPPSIKLTKPCLTATNAASGVDIVTSLEGKTVDKLTELNFDVKSDEHCGAGAPRFNLQLDQDGFDNVFLGCAAGIKGVAAPGWTHVEYTTAEIQAAVVAAGFAPTDTLYDLYIIFDEGTDQPPSAGLTHIDNISVNGTSIGSPTSPLSKDDCKKDGWKNLVGANGQPFKNQGDCVSYQATGGKNLPDGAL
jgi:hypothetical protein